MHPAYPGLEPRETWATRLHIVPSITARGNG